MALQRKRLQPLSLEASFVAIVRNLGDNTPMNKPLADERRDYEGQGLLEEEVSSRNPIEVVETWLNEAIAAGVKDATAMTLATVDAEGWPDARIVLAKGLGPEGVVFYSNYESDKAIHLARPPHGGALVFFWPELFRQVRMRGPVTRVERELSDTYFQSRPRESQLGAWASRQSALVEGRAELEARYRDLERAYPVGEKIPTPSFWGGFRLKPTSFEFWQGRPSRLHDRLRAVGGLGEQWVWSRLAP